MLPEMKAGPLVKGIKYLNTGINQSVQALGATTHIRKLLKLNGL